MGEQIRILGQLIKALCAIQNTSWSQKRMGWNNNLKIGDRTYDTYTQLITRWSPLTERDTEAYFPTNCKAVDFNLSSNRKVLYLPPTSNHPHFIPVISLKCLLSKADNEIKIRIMLIQKRDDSLEGIGFRFELGENNHGYYHAQLIRELHGINRELNYGIVCPVWLPEAEPAIPVRANNPITLLLCLLISLYGLDTCTRLVKEHQISELVNYLKYFRE